MSVKLWRDGPAGRDERAKFVPALIPWEPVRELHSMQSEMNRLFNTFFDSPTQNGGSTQRGWIPAPGSTGSAA